MNKHIFYTETLRHYICAKCKKWWSVSDKKQKMAYCPHCGKPAKVTESKA